MQVRKLPPIADSEARSDVIKLDHSGQAVVSRARLLDSDDEAAPAPAQLPEVAATPLAASGTLIQPISPQHIQAAKEQAAAQTRELTSAEQRDLGVVLAADWSAVHKATRGGTPRQDLSSSGQIERQRSTAPAPAGGSANQPASNSSSLESRLSGLRDAFGVVERPAPTPAPARTAPTSQRRTVLQALQSTPQPTPAEPNLAPAFVEEDAAPTLASELETAEPVRSNAPEAPSIPTLSSRNSQPRDAGKPTLATPPVSTAQRGGVSVASKPQPKSALESSRQRRDPASWDRLESTDDTASSGAPHAMPLANKVMNARHGAAAVASEPVAPAIPRDEIEVDQQEVEGGSALVESATQPRPAAVSAEPAPVASALASVASASSAGGKVDGDKVLMSVAGPQLRAQAAGPRRIVISREAEFQVTVTNDGSVEANDVLVSVQLPNWVDVVGTNPTRGSAKVPSAAEGDQPLSWRIARLDANSSEVLKINLIPRRSQPLDMSVRWTYAPAATNALVEVEEPMLQMVISGPGEAVYGQTKLYNLTLSNPGTGDAQNVVLSLLPLEGKQEAAASTKIGTLAHGETKTIQVELSAGKSGTLLIKANAVADGGLKAEAMKEVLVRRANLMIEVVAPEAEYAGNDATYLLRVLNDGNAPADEVTVNAVLPAGAEFVSSTMDGRFEQKQGRVRWDIGSLAAGQTRELRLAAKLHSPGENRLHTAVQDKTDLNAVADVQTSVVARADLKLLVTDPQRPVPVGEEAVYELIIRNRGTQAAESIEAVIFFSEGIEPVRVEGADHEIGSGQVVFKTIPKINAEGEMVLRVTARADQPGNHVFRAEVLCRAIGTKLAAEETTHFYGKELTAEASRPTARTATRPSSKPLGAAASSPSPLPPARIETQ